MSDRLGLYNSRHGHGGSDRVHRPQPRRTIDFAATRYLAPAMGISMSSLSLSIRSCGSTCWSRCIPAYPAGHGRQLSPTFVSTPAETVGTSAHGGSAIWRQHLLALKIAARGTASSFPQVRASVFPSWRPDSRTELTSTHRIGGAFSSGAVDLALLLPGSWPSGSDTAGRRVPWFCPAASRNPGLGTSLRLTIP